MRHYAPFSHEFADGKVNISSQGRSDCSNTSPFGPIFSAFQKELPEAYKEQFLMPANAPFCIILEGHMSRIWHRPVWLKPFLYILAWFDLLYPETGINIPASMTIVGGFNQCQEPYHLWNRSFYFPRPRRFNALMAFNSTANCVVEQLGPYGVFEMNWDIHFKPPVTLEIVSANCHIHIGRRRFPLPRFAFPKVRAVETIVDEEQNMIHVDLTVSHEKLGDIFGYNGTFCIRRVNEIDGAPFK